MADLNALAVFAKVIEPGRFSESPPNAGGKPLPPRSRLQQRRRPLLSHIQESNFRFCR